MSGYFGASGSSSTSQVNAANGSQAAPSIAFQSDSSLGFFKPSANRISLASNNVVPATFNFGANGGFGLNYNQFFFWTSSGVDANGTPDTVIYRGAAGAVIIGSSVAAFDNAADLGVAAGGRIRSGYFGTSVSVGTNPAQSGAVRLQNNTFVMGRSSGNTVDVQIARVDNLDVIEIGQGDWPHRICTKSASPGGASLVARSISFYIDEAGNNLKVLVKYADGSTVKTGTIALV